MCQVLEIFHFRVYTDRIQGFLTQVGIYVYFNLAFTPRVMLIFPKIILCSLSLIRNWEFTLLIERRTSVFKHLMVSYNSFIISTIIDL